MLGTNMLRYLFLFPFALQAAAPNVEEDYYRITTFTTPAETAMEVGSIELLPEGKLALGTRRGEIWTVTGADQADAAAVKYHRYAEGLHEVLGLAWKDGSLYTTTRYEVTRITDKDDDGRGDSFEPITDGWGVSGDYHEYAFGSRFDKHGDLWITLCLTGSFDSKAKYRGWALRVKPDGKLVPTCSGIRSPGGIGFDAEGAVYYTDNQGPWHGSCTLQHLVPGSFQGHPEGNVWWDEAIMGSPRPIDPIPEAFQGKRKRGEKDPGGDPDRMVTERARIKQLLPPAVYLVHGKIGNSASAIICDMSSGKFGPFSKQLFIGDQSHSKLSRVFLETVNGIKQGIVFPFRSGFASGLIGGRMDAEGRVYVGGSDRGWGARGGKPHCFERLEWTGKVPFEMHEVHARPDGFEISFTQAIDPRSAQNLKSYEGTTAFTYAYREAYGGAPVDQVTPQVTKVSVAPDAKSLRITLDKMVQGHIHELHLEGVQNTEGRNLLHPVGYYTLNEIPK
jgi:hypothetical protein